MFFLCGTYYVPQVLNPPSPSATHQIDRLVELAGWLALRASGRVLVTPSIRKSPLRPVAEVPTTSPVKRRSAMGGGGAKNGYNVADNVVLSRITCINYPSISYRRYSSYVGRWWRSMEMHLYYKVAALRFAAA